MAAENYAFNILHEIVAPDDLFPDKTHEKVANSLFELIQSSERGVTIGLEGGWGSGKSTVVNLLKKQLADQGDNTLFFLFDAWAHDGDPLRRIFLESLIYEIDQKVEDSTLNELKKEISGRKKTVEVTTTKATSRLGGWLSFSAIFVPVGAAMLSGVDYSGLSIFSTTKEPSWFFIVGVLLALCPLWALVLWLVWGEKDKNGFLGKSWDVFTSRTQENYTQDITEDGERTSIEFECFFKKIMNHSIGEGKKHKQALIVVDNLDRVEPEQTLAIWSILQTFFQHRNTPFSNGEGDWASKLWFLVPFDREGLAQVWKQKNQHITIKTSESPLDKPEVPTRNPSEDLAPSFLEKCFQIIAEVPEPVMSAWVEFFEDAIKKALVGWPKEKLNEVIATYKRFESRLESSPTPRQIQAFSNRVGMLGIRWHDEMSAEAMALYALVRKNRSDRQLRKILLDEGLPDGYEGATDNYELKMQLAGMLFGVDKSMGIQLLLGPEIRSALKDGESENLKKLIETHGEAFWVVWQAIRESSLPNGHVEEYRIAVTKAFCGGVCNHKERASSDVSRLIFEWKRSKDKWELNKHDYSGALTALFGIVGSKDKQDELLSWLEAIVKKAILNVTSLVGGDKFEPSGLSNISKLVDLLKKHGRVFRRAPYPKLDASTWGSWLDTLASEGIEIDFVLPAKGTIKSLASSINATNAEAKTLDILSKTLTYLPKDEEWDDVTDQLTVFANSQTHALGIDTFYKLMSNMYLLCNESVAEKIKVCVKSTPFKTGVEREAVDTVPSLLVLCATVFEDELLGDGTSQKVKNFWQEDFDQKKCGPVFEILKEQENLPIVWLLALETENKVTIGFIKNNMDESIYRSPLGLENIDVYDWASDEDLKTIITKSADYGGLNNAKSTLLDSPIIYRKCLKLIKLYGGSEGCGIVEDVLKSTTSAQWVEALLKDTDLFDCIGAKGDHEFKEGIHDLLLQELEKGQLSPHIWEQFLNIYNKLMDKEDVAEDIANKYINLDIDPLSDQAFDQLATCMSSFISKLDSDCLMKRVELWLSGAQWKRIEWLLTSGMKFDGTPKESLASRVSALLENREEDHRDMLFEVATLFNIQIDVQVKEADIDAQEDAEIIIN